MKKHLMLFAMVIFVLGCDKLEDANLGDDLNGNDSSTARGILAGMEAAEAEVEQQEVDLDAPEGTRVRFYVRWGGSRYSCANWKRITLKGSNPLFLGHTVLFEFGDGAGMDDEYTAFASTLTCGHFDQGAISMEVTDDATATLNFDMEDLRINDGDGSNVINQGEIDVTAILPYGGLLVHRLSGRNYIAIRAVRY